MLQQKLASFVERRENAGPLPSGVAPFTSSDLFKSRDYDKDPATRQWDEFWSAESMGRGSSSLKVSATTARPRPVISLGVGRPVGENIPWISIDMRAVISTSDKDKVDAEPMQLMTCRKGDQGYDLDAALNYGFATGSPQLLRFATEHVELVHNPPYSDWQCCLTCGTTSALDILLRMFCNRGDWVLTEEYTYAGATEAMKPQGIRICGISMDGNGLVPEDLDLKLQNWDTKKGPKPTVLYTIPCGQNPTGITQPLERRRAIYEIAGKHDLCILEDDPYYFLQLGISTGQTDAQIEFSSEARERYLKNLPTSYLSLDRSGRVVRLDTTSKVLAPGLRCGWLTASSQVVAKFMNFTDFSSVAPSGPSQVMLYKLLDETWGHAGFLNWLMNTSIRYRRRSDTLIRACEHHLPLNVCRWGVPTFGMFLWVQLDWSSHPSFLSEGSIAEGCRRRLDVEEKVYARATENGVGISKGSWFTDRVDLIGPINIRLTFAAASQNSMNEAVIRLGSAIRAEFGMDKAT